MFEPLNGTVLVQVNEDTKTSFGIIVPKDNSKEILTGKVIVGGEKVKKGDTVLFGKYGSDEITIDKKVHFIVNETSIRGKLT